jgi:hypothetical protein
MKWLLLETKGLVSAGAVRGFEEDQKDANDL